MCVCVLFPVVDFPGHPGLVRDLLAAKADLSLPVNMGGLIPVSAAFKSGNAEVLKVLLEQGDCPIDLSKMAVSWVHLWFEDAAHGVPVFVLFFLGLDVECPQ